MLERQIEFAYEAKRFWDLRRNMLFEALLNGTRRHGVTITLTVPAAQWNQVRNTVDLESEYQNYLDRKSTRLNSSHTVNSYAVFCLKKKNKKQPYRSAAMSSQVRLDSRATYFAVRDNDGDRLVSCRS